MKYELIYSKRRTIGLSIKDGTLIVRAPYRTPQKTVESVIKRHEAWILKNTEKSLLKKEKYGNLTEEKIKELKLEAKTYLIDKTKYYSDLMGLKYGRITITSAKTRFGSCSSKGNISFSYRLMLYPEPAREYVVVHELAHLVEMNHSPAFYKIVASVLPDYKVRRALLKQ